MQSKMGTIRFVLRNDKPDKDGISPIQLIYQLRGQRKYFKTGEKLRAENWDPDLQKAKYIDKKTAKKALPTVPYDLWPAAKEIEDINSELTSFKKEIGDIEHRFKLNKVIYSPDMVVQALRDNRSPTTKKEAPSNQVFDFIDKYIEDHKTTREAGSLAVYKTLRNHLAKFQKDKKRKITFDSIDFSFFQDFQNYLLTPRQVLVPSKNPTKEPKWKTIQLNNTTVAKQLSTIKTFMNYAKDKKLIVSEDYKRFKIKKENLEVIALTNSEFETLFNLDLSANKKLDQVRDVFCFACSTGLRFSDIDQLKREHIKRDEIRLIVKKTKEQLSIPITLYSSKILSKYKDAYRPLPVISNQKTNLYIKELCKKAEINEPVEIVRFRGTKRESIVYPKYQLISIHTGRKTFCTLALEKGLSAEEVMQISGHKDYRSFKRYVKITDLRTKVVMQKAWGEAPESNLKAV